MEVRDVHPHECLAAGAVTLAAYRALPGAHLSDGYARELEDVATRAQGAHVIVAVEDGRVLGTATYVGSARAGADGAEPGEDDHQESDGDGEVHGKEVGTDRPGL